ncbi:hypothetical protein PROFUN_01698 [Planoprotostelium fungivorum]|uniref:Alpha-2-macroglobulin domain-containing protein n=1 Tax=Planoprotostelium fungivorum TaxID=1890364 RepID=A0A2P6MW92_9EUKA|nr:hypothetical protein PROFUN_01698 [Planoprotostelium fungivorum]
MAAYRGHTETVQLLLSYPRVDPSVKDNEAIVSAVIEGHSETVRLLLSDSRVDPAAQDNRAIKYAADEGHSETVQLLLSDPRVDPSADDNDAIRGAARRGHTETVRLLLTHSRVNPSAKDNEAIRKAASNGHHLVAIRRASENVFIHTVQLLLADDRLDPSRNDLVIQSAARGQEKSNGRRIHRGGGAAEQSQATEVTYNKLESIEDVNSGGDAGVQQLMKEHEKGNLRSNPEFRNKFFVHLIHTQIHNTQTNKMRIIGRGPAPILPTTPEEQCEKTLFVTAEDAPVESNEPNASQSQAVPVEFHALSEQQVQTIYDRLPALTQTNTRSDAFHKRSDTPKPPTAEKKIEMTFPPQEEEPGRTLREPSEQKLQVLSSRPEGKIDSCDRVTLTFSHSLADITTLDQLDAVAEKVFTLEPRPEGKFGFEGTNTVTFTSTKPFPMATRYTVKVSPDLQTPTGTKMEGAFETEFTLPPPEMHGLYPFNGITNTTQIFVARFNQKVDSAKVLEKVSLEYDGKKHPVRLFRDDDTADQEIKGMMQERDCCVAFIVEDLPVETSYRIVFGEGLPSAEGPLTTTEKIERQYQTYGPLKVNGSQDGQIILSNPLHDSFDAERDVTVNPPMGGVSVSSHIIYFSGMKTRENYKVKLNTSLKDVYGQTLSAPFEVEMKGPEPTPQLYSPFNGFITLDPSTSDSSDLWSFPFFAAHHEKVSVNLRKLSVDDVIAYRSQNAKITERGQSVSEYEITPVEDVTYRVDLQPAMTDVTHHYGFAAVCITPVVKEEEDQKNQHGKRFYRHVEQIAAVIQMTKLSASIFSHGDKATVLVKSLMDQSVVEGAVIRSGAQEYTTDENGSVVIPLLSENQDGWISISKGEDRMVVNVPPIITFKPSQRVYGATDRGLYKPKEEVHVKCMVRDVREDGLQIPPKGTTVTIVIRSPRWQEISQFKYETNEHGNFDFSFPLAAESDLGVYSVQRVDSNNNNEEICSFSIQEFRKPEFKSSSQVTSTGPFIMNGEATVSTSASYYSGGPLSDSNVSWRISPTKSHFSPPGWNGLSFCENNMSFFRFFEPQQNEHEEPVVVEGKTDGRGEHSTKILFKGHQARYQPVTIGVEAVVQDINRQTLSSRASLLVHPASVYVGLKAKKMLGRVGEEIPIEYVVSNIKGDAVDGRDIEILVTTKETKKNEGGEYVSIDKEIQKFTKKSGKGVQTFHITTPQNGSHTIQVTVKDDENRIQLTTISLYVIGGEEKKEQIEQKTNNPMEEAIYIMADKPSYQVGDEAEILFKNPLFPSRGGYAIVTSTKVSPLIPITFTKNEETVKFTITEDMMPAVRVQVMSEGYSETQQLPVWSNGSKDLPVSTETKSLTVSPSPAAQDVTPGSSTKVRVQVKDHEGEKVRGSEVTLIVVDEAILSMSDHKIRDPLPLFYTSIQRWIRVVFSRESIIAQRNIEPPSNRYMAPRGFGMSRRRMMAFNAAPSPAACLAMSSRSIGAADTNPTIQVRDNFNSLAAWIGSSVTDDEGQLELDIKMPDTLTNYRIIALASEGRDRFGVGESEIRVSLPLALRPSIPRFCNYGDRVRLSTVVVNQTPKKREVSIVIRSEQVRFEENRGYRLTMEPNGRTEVPFKGTTDHTGRVFVQFAMSSEETEDAVTIEIPVYTPSTSEDFATYGDTAETTVISQTIQPPIHVIPEFGRLEVATSSTLLSSLLDSYKYLYRYPYGCSEQVASRLLSNVTIGPLLSSFVDAVDGLPNQKEIEKSIKADIEKLRQRHVSGGFRFWDEGEVSPYVTVHCLHALVRYRKTLSGQEWEIRQLIDWTISSFSSWSASVPKECLGYIHMYFLYACTLYNGTSDNHHTKAAELLGDDFSTKSTEYLCWALQVLHGKNAEKEKELLRVLMNRITESADKAHVQESTKHGHNAFVYLLGNDGRGVGALLETLIKVSPDHHIIPKLVRGLMSRRSSRGIWANTQENSFSLLGLRAYFDKYETDVPDYKVNQWYGETYVGTTQHEGRNTEVKSISVPMDVLLSSSGQKELVMEKKGKGRLYYRVGLTYALSNLTVDSRDRGFEVSRQYVAVDDKGDVVKREDGTWKIRMGARVKVEITVKNRDPRYHVALVDNLPAGMEALNSAIKNTESVPSSGARSFCYLPYFHSDHKNLRDDRLEVFSSYVYPGEKKYEFYMRATNGGVFTAPPTKVEEMYSPEVFGRSASDKLYTELPNNDSLHYTDIEESHLRLTADPQEYKPNNRFNDAKCDPRINDCIEIESEPLPVSALVILPVVCTIGLDMGRSKLLVFNCGLCCSDGMGLIVSSFPNINAAARRYNCRSSQDNSS